MTPRRLGAVALTIAALTVTTVGSGCTNRKLEQRRAELAAEASEPVVASDAPTTTVFVVATTSADLIDQLIAEATGLSEAIIDGDQAATMARIDAVWDALDPILAEEDPVQRGEYDSVVDLLRLSADKRRPSDADKAVRYLTALRAAGEAGVSSTVA